MTLTGSVVATVADTTFIVPVSGSTPNLTASGPPAGSPPSTCSSSATAASVSSPAYASPTREKLVGREEALRAVGIEPNGYVAHGPFTVTGGRLVLRALMEANADAPPTAVICSNDLMAIGALQEAAALGLRVPDDLSIVGFDGIEATEWTQPALTTIEQPIDVIAKTAIAALTTQIEDPDQALANYVFRPRLKLGGTTAAFSI